MSLTLQSKLAALLVPPDRGDWFLSPLVTGCPLVFQGLALCLEPSAVESFHIKTLGCLFGTKWPLQGKVSSVVSPFFSRARHLATGTEHAFLGLSEC
jgi:hypothetical protein